MVSEAYCLVRVTDYSKSSLTPVATLSGAPEFAFGEVVFRSLAVPSRGSTRFAIWALELAPGMSGDAYSLDCEEVQVIHSGQINDRGTVQNP